MKDKIQGTICQGLEHFSDPRGVGFLDKFTPLDLGDCANIISYHIPLYSEENVDIVLNYVLEAFDTKEKKIKFVEKSIIYYTGLFIKGNKSPEVLTTLVFWTNALNVLLHETELHQEEENFKNCMLSFILPNMEEVMKQVDIDKEQATTVNVGEHFLRIIEDDFTIGLVPTEKTKNEFKKYLL